MTQFETDQASPFWPLFSQARDYILSFEGVVETQKPRITTYANSKGGICHLRTMPRGIDIGFLKGARLRDTNSRLSGNGKTLRILSLSEFDRDTIDCYFQQAIAINS